MSSSGPVTGLILTGGGARAAYQVGVLRAIARIRARCGQTQGNPFQVISGTSAGAVNASALAAGADDFDLAVARLAMVWRGMHASHVYRADSLGVLRTGAGWLTMMSLGWIVARWRKLKPRSLLDNAPLKRLLKQMVPLDRVPSMIAGGHLKALAVTASSYTTGQHLTFYDAEHDAPPWVRSQRRAVRTRITQDHLLASSAIPFVFPSTALELDGALEWFGDGSMRQVAPVSPAVHLGAERVLVIGAGRLMEPAGRRDINNDYPSLAQIAGHAMSSIFLDALTVDVERLERINHTLSLMRPEARAATPLRPIKILVIAPTQRIDDLAAKHLDALPAPVRALLRGVGVSGQGREARGAALASYLLFEADFTRELMDLGEADTEARRDEVLDFFGWAVPAPIATTAGPADQRAAAVGVALTAEAACDRAGS
jgi:NTE family protein